VYLFEFIRFKLTLVSTDDEQGTYAICYLVNSHLDIDVVGRQSTRFISRINEIQKNKDKEMS